ncbi:LacI family transcriptional regulator [Roseiarcus fermentans]|uniref:LacI family transcriptional regulator n=1 Tax=Roseiarcus fermentans TaxID=1473586 RepID=A0A366ETM6_9HYPH|nr:LacI family DNA-binding transcriptional regulator [Roseiarcus fermentans]RBP05747.1 LacI family transcriptional regulator [Roseiarcus fermentans]
MARKPIIADVARLAGVSTATVDRVLNDRGGVRPDKAALVLSAARRLRLDRTLARKYARVQRIAVLIQSSDNPFHAALRDAFATAGRAYADLNLQFLIHHIAFDDARAIAERIRSLGPRHDGLIVTSPEDRRIAAAAREVARTIPVIALATDLPDGGRAAYVGPDDRQAGRVAGDLMGRFLGREGGDIVMISGLLSLRGQREREAGFRRVLADHYPGCRVEGALESREDAERAGLLVAEALKRNPAIRGVYHVTAGAAEVAAALAALGRGDVALIAHELTEERRALLRARAIAAIIDQNPEFEVRAAIEVMARLLGRMEGPAGTTVTPVNIYTAENV